MPTPDLEPRRPQQQRVQLRERSLALTACAAQSLEPDPGLPVPAGGCCRDVWRARQGAVNPSEDRRDLAIARKALRVRPRLALALERGQDPGGDLGRTTPVHKLE